MVSTKTYEIKKFSGLDNVPAGKVRAFNKPEGAPVPKVKYDLVNQMNSEINTTTADPINQRVDIIPDFRYILLYLFYYCTAFYKTLDQSEYPMLSPPSLVCYCLLIIHAHFLVVDQYCRDSPSRHAEHFMSTEKRCSYLRTLLNLPVPKFVEDLLLILSPTTDPRRPQISFLPTYAGFSYHHDFGRFFPVSVFSTAHNMLATAQASANPALVLQTWMMTPLITQGPFPPGPTTVLNVANLLGAIQHNGQLYDSWLYQAFYTLLNPIVVRSLARRAIFDPFETFPIDLSDPRHSTPLHGDLNGPIDTVTAMNPYIFALSADKDSLDEMIRFCDTMSNLASTHLDCSNRLGARYDTSPGLDILIHGYSSLTLPTWTQRNPTDMTPPAMPALLQKRSPTQYATSTHYLVPRPFTAAGPHRFPDDATTIHQSLYFISKLEYDPDSPDIEFQEFDADEHVSPRIRVLDPYDTNPSTGYKPCIAGLIIETGDIDGFGIPQPNPAMTLSSENSLLLNSAVPLSRICPATNFEHTSVPLRALHTADNQSVLLALRDMSKNFMCRLARNGEAPVPIRNLFGTTTVARQPWFDMLSNVFGYQTGIRARSMGRTADMPNGHITAWSPYRFVADPLPTTELHGIFMLLNLRTLFGTGTPLMETDHPSVRIPRK
jgi:hypothetical protein